MTAPSLVCVDSAGRPLNSNTQTLIVQSPQANKLIKFYQRLGIAFELQNDKNGKQAAVGRCPGFAVKITTGPAASREPQQPLGFFVDDLSRILQIVAEQGGKVLQAAEPTSDGRKAVVSDPAGRRFNIFESGAAEAEADEFGDLDLSTISTEMETTTAIDNSHAPVETPAKDPTAPLDAAQVKSLRLGSTTMLVGLAILFVVVVLTMLTFKPPELGRRRVVNEQAPSVVPLIPTVIALVGAVLQMIGKMQMLGAGNAVERGVLILAVALEAVGTMARVGALSFANEPYLAVAPLLIAAGSHVNFLLLCYFYFSVLKRFGDPTARTMSVVLMVVSLAALLAAVMLIVEPSAALWYVFGTVTFFVLAAYVALLIRLVGVKPAVSAAR
ncbi:MAG: hypothetical protein QM775_05280 [Pirellulales bacterium]